ncbi:uncharacterized protein GGS22DRAFT_165911 [Annulohypoxylon maeteangense]|uniref:uncharacterized protein n=1 Tax=Annulohypoxylon maeteangense TaxID=1927788 RepID=UPI002007386E|nr:uncharacterized protein GGS22DRAFT_165911 [Annulohypoxylon maeteangense]KAI0883716.1 hypothetical protein GGS22DRAFT_165911 [Annulohypoxylon maeteangense]
MGNSPSAEASRKGQRTAQKLSKPKTGNPTAAGLLSTTGLSSSIRPSPGARRLSLPYAPSPTTASPAISEAVPTVPAVPEVTEVTENTEKVSAEKKGLELGSRISRKLFRSNTFREFTSRRKRSESVDVPSSQQERWSSTTSSLRNGPEDGYGYNQAPIQGSLSMNVSRTSSHYDLGSYEAKRLLNLVEAPSYETNSVVSGGHMYISESVHGDFRGRRPSIPETTPEMTRANSEISLYTPMRRKSLMTPGIATREIPTDPGPSRPRVRHSLPSTPARRGSVESLCDEAARFPPLSIDPSLIPRALTPCEAEYKQTGAFKLGTLRITNGSPARSPARNPDEDMKFMSSEMPLVGEPTVDYFEPKKLSPTSNIKPDISNITLKKADAQDTNGSPGPSRSSLPDALVSPSFIESQEPTYFLPERQSSPPSHDEQLEIPQVQVTSKHTAMEDELFEDDQNEYSSIEILDVRVDTNAKSLPRPKLTSEKRGSREVIRADSGIASPASEYSHAPLSKADSGYSSSISLRSFSSKPSALEKDRSSEKEVETLNNSNMKQGEDVGELKAVTPTAVIVTTVVPKLPVDETAPPPVPVKDPHLLALASPRGTSGMLPSAQKSPTSPVISKHSRAQERIISPSYTQIQASRNLKIHRANLHSSSTSNSSLRIGTGIRKPGKFQRFLSGSRAPLTAHSTHPTEYASVPAVSKDLQVRLQTHTGSMPMSLRRLTLKSAASKETLGTILSVGSAELLQDDDMSPKSSSGQLWTSDRIQRKPISMRSSISHSTSITAKKPIPRKPVPIRTNDYALAGEVDKSPKDVDESSGEKNIVGTIPAHVTGGDIETDDSNQLVMEDNQTRFSVPVPRLAKSNATASHVEKDLETNSIGTERVYEFARGESHSLTSLEIPTVVSNIKFSKSPPPVSMRTRNMKSRRFSAPIRPQSTPPEMRWPGRFSYPRRESQEGNGRAPESIGTFTSDHTGIPRSYSQDDFRTFNPAQYGRESSSISIATNLRTMSLRSDVRKIQVPNWNVQADHGPTLSRPSSSDHIRRGSLGSQSSQQGSATIEPSFFQQNQYLHPNPPSLHRRSSYDEYNLLPHDNYVRDNGPYPSMPRNGRAFVSDPRSGRSMSMPQQWDQKLDQPARYPPYASHHQRHRSLDQYGNPMPYRVLHSYNSPAYRNVPIWR